MSLLLVVRLVAYVIANVIYVRNLAIFQQIEKFHSGPLPTVPDNYFPVKTLVSNPGNACVLNFMLTDYPDQALVKFLVSGFTFGFCLGYNAQIT